MAFIASDEPKTKVTNNEGMRKDFLPTKKLRIPVNKKTVLSNGTVKPRNSNKILNAVRFRYPKNQMNKSDLLTLDFIAQNQWERPVYFTITAGRSAYAGLENHLRLDGLVYCLVPIRDNKDLDQQTGWINPEITYSNLMTNFEWGNMPNQNLYLDNVMREQCKNYRNIFNRLGLTLIKRDQKKRAVKVMDRLQEVTPRKNVPFDFNTFYTVRNYYSAGATKKAKALGKRLTSAYTKALSYYLSLDRRLQKQVKDDIENKLYCLNQMRKLAKRNGQKAYAKQLSKSFNRFDKQYRKPD